MQQITCEEYEQAQRGLSTIASAYAYLVDAAVAAGARRCNRKADTSNTQKDAGKVLRRSIARYAQEHKTFAGLDEFALREVVVYLTGPKQFSQWLKKIADEQAGHPFDPANKDDLNKLRDMAVRDVMVELDTLRTSGNVICIQPDDVGKPWGDVKKVYRYSDRLLRFLIEDKTNGKLMEIFVKKTLEHLKNISREEVQAAAEDGISRAMYRWEPDHGSFTTAAAIWMKNRLWIRVDRNGVPQDKYELIGEIFRAENDLYQKADGRTPTEDEIVRAILTARKKAKEPHAQKDVSRPVKTSHIEVSDVEVKAVKTRVKEALQASATMNVQSLNEMDSQLSTVREEEFAEQLSDGPLSLGAADLAPLSCLDPSQLIELEDEIGLIELRAKILPRSELFAFWVDVVEAQKESDLPPAYAARFQAKLATRNRLAKRATICIRHIDELARWLPRSVCSVFSRVIIEGKDELSVALEQRLDEAEVTRRVKDASRMLALLSAMVVQQAPARAMKIPLPPRKIFKQIDALVNTSPPQRERLIRDEIEERPVDEYREIPVGDDLLKGIRRSLLEVSVEHLPPSEKQVHLLHYSELESLDEIAVIRKITPEVAQRFLRRSELLADLPAELIACLPNTARSIIEEIDVDGFGVAHAASDLQLNEREVKEGLNAARRVLVLLAAISRPLLRDRIVALLQTTEPERERIIQCEIEERPLDEFRRMARIQAVHLQGVLEEIQGGD